MFLQELKPIAKKVYKQPIAFAGGFVSGALRLKLSDDPLKSWLQKQGVTDFSSTDLKAENTSRPTSISID